ncbi:cysteine-rich CWC family protein, partial [Shewanella sp.]|nr:cysteine-rich CWC family protein [Shewanella sp.]
MSIDPTQCPLCQANNRCAVQQGKGIEQCWCVLQPFPSKSILEEEKLSLEASASRACLCQSCI